MNVQPESLTLDAELNNQIVRFKAEAQDLAAIEIKSEGQRTNAMEVKREATATKKNVEIYFEKTRTLLHKAWKSCIADIKGFTDPCDLVISTVNEKVGNYDLVQDQKRLAEQRRLQAIEDEKNRREQDRLNKQAANLNQEYSKEKIEALTEQASELVPPVVEVAHQTRKNEHTLTTYSFVVTDPKNIPRDYMIPNQRELDAWARRTKGHEEMPGGRVHKKFTPVAR